MIDQDKVDQLCWLVMSRIQTIARNVEGGDYPNRRQRTFLCPRTGVMSLSVTDSDTSVIGVVVEGVSKAFPMKMAATQTCQSFVCHKATWEHVAIALHYDAESPTMLVITVQTTD